MLGEFTTKSFISVDAPVAILRANMRLIFLGVRPPLNRDWFGRNVPTFPCSCLRSSRFYLRPRGHRESVGPGTSCHRGESDSAHWSLITETVGAECQLQKGNKVFPLSFGDINTYRGTNHIYGTDF